MENKRWLRSVPTKELKTWKLEGYDRHMVERELGRRRRKNDKRLKKLVDAI